MKFPIVETDCTITGPNGQQFTNSGAIFDLDRGGCLYVNKPASGNVTNNGSYVPFGSLETWHGKHVGTYWAISKYRNNMGARITCIRATIAGREYYGRYGSDWSQLVRLRPRRTA